MRREGRIHGSNVRVNKKEFWSLERASSKPTNHSKVSARCPGNGVRCVGCSHGLPVKKSIGKVKTALKARDLDVTKNHKMAEWSFSQKHRWEDYDGPISGGEYSDDEHERHSFDSDEVKEYWADDQHSRSPVIVCPIELLLQKRKSKATRPPVFIPEAQIISSATTESAGSAGSAGSAESYDESEYETDKESWSDFEFSDGEEISHAEDAAEDDWEFVIEL